MSGTNPSEHPSLLGFVPESAHNATFGECAGAATRPALATVSGRERSQVCCLDNPIPTDYGRHIAPLEPHSPRPPGTG